MAPLDFSAGVHWFVPDELYAVPTTIDAEFMLECSLIFGYVFLLPFVDTLIALLQFLLTTLLEVFEFALQVLLLLILYLFQLKYPRLHQMPPSLGVSIVPQVHQKALVVEHIDYWQRSRASA